MVAIHSIANFLWGIADEVLRDDFKRGKYPDVILPFVVLRRLDCVLTEHWHESKERIDVDRWYKALGWMRDQGLVPAGRGSHTIEA